MVHEYESELFPGLLQTGAYAEQVMNMPATSRSVRSNVGWESDWSDSPSSSVSKTVSSTSDQ
jgi:hypothetical protein